MSLKAFHVVFIFVSTALTIGFGFWAIRDYLHFGNPVSLAMAIGAFVGFVVLVWYARWFLRKLKHLSYL